MPTDDALLPTQQHEWPGEDRLDPIVLHRRRERLFLVFAGLFLGTLAMLNILGISRFIKLGQVDFDGDPATVTVFAVAVGVLPYPITFLCTDFISELYGRARANFVVLVGLLLNGWVIFIMWLGGALPGFEAVGSSGEVIADTAQRVADGGVESLRRPPVFFEMRTLAFGAVAASMIAYVVAQLIDVQLFHFWKRVTGGRFLWIRNNASTLVSQLADTTSVVLITHFYALALPVQAEAPLWPQLLVFIGTAYAFKFVAAACDTVPFVLLAPRLARYLRLPPPATHPHPSHTMSSGAGVG